MLGFIIAKTRLQFEYNEYIFNEIKTLKYRNRTEH